MNVFKRIHDIFSSNVNHALDKMEDPAKMIRYTIVEMENSLAKAKASAAEILATIKTREAELKVQKEAVGKPVPDPLDHLVFYFFCVECLHNPVYYCVDLSVFNFHKDTTFFGLDVTIAWSFFFWPVFFVFCWFDKNDVILWFQATER